MDSAVANMHTKLLLIVGVLLIHCMTWCLCSDGSVNSHSRNKRDTMADKCRQSDQPIPEELWQLKRQLVSIHHDLKGFYPLVIGVVNQREVKRDRSNLQQIRTESLEEINDSSSEQERKTSERSINVEETQSVTTSSMVSFSNEVSVGLSVGASFFGATAEASVGVTNSKTQTREDSTTSSITKSILFTMPSQTVKCPPRKKIELKWNFYSYTDTVHYLVDYVLDEDESYFKGDDGFAVAIIRHKYQQLRPEDNWQKTLSDAQNRARTLKCFKLKYYDFLPDTRRLEQAEPFHRCVLERADGNLYLKNVPVQVKVDGHHGQFTTKETDL